MERRRFLTTTATLVVPLVAGCTGSGGGGGGGGGGDGGGGGSASIEETSSVTMANNQFDPRNIKVETGSTVTWTNEDDFEHTVTSASNNWQKDTQVGGGGETSHTFDEGDVYDVFCSIHGSADLSGMSMKIGVGDATIGSPLGGGGSDGDGGGGYGGSY